MDRYFTIMVVPEREKGVKSFRIPRIFFRSFLFLCAIFVIVLSILIYDYWKILRQVYENQHLTIENRQLKEQVQLFQMKINTLGEDIDRIRTFEKKLKIITGIAADKNSSQSENYDKEILRANEGDGGNAYPASNVEDENTHSHDRPQTSAPKKSHYLDQILPTKFKERAEYKQLKNLYEQKIASIFGLGSGHTYTRKWSELTKQSFTMADKYAQFDYRFNILKSVVGDLEVRVHQLDRFLLDKESFLKSTPTLLPTKGWITSNYGPRISPTSKRLGFHEGLDIGARTGTKIVAPADGIVTYSGSKSGFGKIIQLDHGYGMETIYAHAKSLKVTRGQTIKRGQTIAYIGNTGKSTGPHLHYEVRINGTPVDPLNYTLD